MVIFKFEFNINILLYLNFYKILLRGYLVIKNRKDRKIDIRNKTI